MGYLSSKRLLLLSVVVTIASACSSSLAPTEPETPVSELSFSQGSGGSSGSGKQLLACSEQPKWKTTKVVGRAGGLIVMGPHRLLILPGALNRDVTITGEVDSKKENSVRFQPEGLQFAVPALLTLSYENCRTVLAPKFIVYTNDLLQILETEPSADNPFTKVVHGQLRHFSRYGIAW